MGLVEIRDFQIWGNHIHDDDTLKRRIFGMKPGELIELEIDGYLGFWKKMRDNRSTGGPTHGLKPLGKSRRYWHHLYSERHEDLVSIAEA